ncbi:MAG: histidinol-phosphate aminotransferase family protein [Chloroflexi bacterium]|nr:histidinol-phosphate aminotransferase family protein [Chloroflexota bacterium]
MSAHPREAIAGLARCHHGSLSSAELERLYLSPEAVVDFSVNTNPLGPSPAVAEALSRVAIPRYPDDEATQLRRLLALRHDVAVDNVVVGNGSVELIRLAALAYVSPGDVVLIFSPTFGEYEVASRIMGGQVLLLGSQKSRLSGVAGECVILSPPQADEESRHTGAETLRYALRRSPESFGQGDSFAQSLNGFQESLSFELDVDTALAAISSCSPKVVFLCNPNNPTGTYLAREAVEDVVRAAEGSLVVVDEAYVNFVENAWPSEHLIRRPNVLLLRSMTKDYALTGLRIGYGLAGAQVVDALEKVRPPWNVNAFAQAAAIASLGDGEHLARSRRQVDAAKRFLADELSHLGFVVVPSRANFLLVRVGDATSFRLALLRQGLCVRDCTSFGLPEYVRLGVRTLPECRQLLATVREVLRS